MGMVVMELAREARTFKKCGDECLERTGLSLYAGTRVEITGRPTQMVYDHRFQGAVPIKFNNQELYLLTEEVWVPLHND